MASKSGTLYTGMTGALKRRVYEHKLKLVERFTKKYDVTGLLFFEETNDLKSAVEREKQIKGWSRKKKLDLIKMNNLEWEDLSNEWFE